MLLIKAVNTGKIEAILSHAVPWLVGAHTRPGSLVTCALLMGNQAQQDQMTCHKSTRGWSSPLDPKIPGCCASLLSLKASRCWTYWRLPQSRGIILAGKDNQSQLVSKPAERKVIDATLNTGHVTKFTHYINKYYFCTIQMPAFIFQLLF